MTQKNKNIIVFCLTFIAVVASFAIIYKYNETLVSYKDQLSVFASNNSIPLSVVEEFYKIQKEQFQVYIAPLFGWTSTLLFYFINQKARDCIHWNNGEMTLTPKLPSENVFFYNFSKKNELEAKLGNNDITHLNFYWNLDNKEKDAIKYVKIKKISIIPICESQIDVANDLKNKKIFDWFHFRKNMEQGISLIAVKVKEAKIIPIHKKGKSIRMTTQSNTESENILKFSWLINQEKTEEILQHLENNQNKYCIRMDLTAVVKFKRYGTQRYKEKINFKYSDIKNYSALVRS